MVRKSRADWRPVQLPKSLVDEVEKTIQVDEVKKQGITSISQFISRAVNEKLVELESKHLNHLNMYEDHVKILDSKLEGKGRIVSVYFKREGKPYCDYCGETDCVHVQYAWELPEARKVLERHGLQPPPSRV